jgi:hypothetical protein
MEELISLLWAICPMRQTLTVNSLVWTDSATKSIVVDERQEIMTRISKGSSGDLTPIRPVHRDSRTILFFDDEKDDSKMNDLLMDKSARIVKKANPSRIEYFGYIRDWKLLDSMFDHLLTRQVW